MAGSSRHPGRLLRAGIFLRGSGLEVLWPDAVVLLGMGVLGMGMAVLRFRKTLE